MTQTKKVMITAILAVFLLFAGGIGIVSAEDAAQFLSGNDYNITASDANSSVWYYDSATGYLWTGPDTGLTSLPVYLKALGANTIYGYTFLVVDPDYELFETPGEFSLVPTVYTHANTIIDSPYDPGTAGISASVSLGNSTTIGPDYSNIVNVSFRSPQTIDSSYRFYFDSDSVAVSAIDIDNVTIMDITSSENIPGSYPAGIIFYVRNIPSFDNFTISDAENRNATNAGTVYYYQERDGTANLTALITNVTATDAYTWNKKSTTGDLTLTFADKTPGRVCKPFSTLAEQAAQFMPEMGIVIAALFPVWLSVSGTVNSHPLINYLIILKIVFSTSSITCSSPSKS